MDLNRFNRRRTSRIYLYILLLVACSFLSFLLGVVMLRNGTLRKLYDIYDAVALSSERIPYIKSTEKLDTLYIQLSKKNYNRLVKLRSDSFLTPKNYLNYYWQWIGERPWVKTEITFEKASYSNSKVKLIGANTDHFRDGANWSTRVKLDKDDYFMGYSKFNLLNPITRGFFVDQFYNCLYKKEGGLFINQTPLFVQLGPSLNPVFLEPFFSKELLELQQRRDYLIFSADSVDRYGVIHLRVVHPSSNLSLLTKNQMKSYLFYDSLFLSGNLAFYINRKNLAFVLAVGVLTGGQDHHVLPGNFYLYADPISGDLKPFLREISLVYKGGQLKYDSVKSEIYKKAKLVEFVKSVPDFELLVNYYVLHLNSINFFDILRNDKDLLRTYDHAIKNYPSSFIYRNYIKSNLIGLPNTKVSQNLKKSISVISGDVVLKNTVRIFTALDSLVLREGSTIRLYNSTLIVNNINFIVNGSGSQVRFVGDSLSTILFDNCNIDLCNVSFEGFGNRLHPSIKNRELTGAITFSNSKVHLSNAKFSNNYSGDDLVNFFRCTVDIAYSTFKNGKADGIDFDFTSGQFVNSKVLNCGNDGLDLGGSALKIKSTIVANCGDKGISIGEASERVLIDSVSILSNEIGISLKDASLVSLSKINFIRNKVDFVAYGKKAQYGQSVLVDSDIDFAKISYLIEPDVLLPSGVNVSRTKKVVDLMYGKKYGRKSIR